MKTTLTILCILALAQAQTFTHNRLTENGKTFSQDGTNLIGVCMAPKPSALAAEDMQTSFWQQKALCAGYIEAVADLLSDTNVCIPPEIPEDELEKAVVAYAAKHEDKMHGPASRIVASALQETYPCPIRK